MTHHVSLADVYSIDFGRRTEDFPVWEHMAQVAKPGPVIEVGCGDGRLRHCFGDRPYAGIELDPVLAARARSAGVRPVAVGDASDPEPWTQVGYGNASLVFCAYSTLYLVPHDRQRRVVAEMAKVVSQGGILAIEVFKPEPGFPALPKPPTEIQVLSPNGPDDGPWLRRSEFSTGRPTYDPWGNVQVTTEIVRRYGPSREKWTMEMRETVYYTAWAAIAQWVQALGFVLLTAPSPPGSILIAGVRRW